MFTKSSGTNENLVDKTNTTLARLQETCSSELTHYLRAMKGRLIARLVYAPTPITRRKYRDLSDKLCITFSKRYTLAKQKE